MARPKGKVVDTWKYANSKEGHKVDVPVRMEFFAWTETAHPLDLALESGMVPFARTEAEAVEALRTSSHVLVPKDADWVLRDSETLEQA